MAADTRYSSIGQRVDFGRALSGGLLRMQARLCLAPVAFFEFLATATGTRVVAAEFSRSMGDRFLDLLARCRLGIDCL